MQLVLELLKKIFIALQGVYTKQETDEIAAPIDWLMTAVDGDWKTYMLARASQTGVQANIDTVNRAIKEYNTDNTSALAGRLIEDWKNLYVDFEAWLMLTGEATPLVPAFWVKYFEALSRWEANPDETVAWTQNNKPPAEVASVDSPYVISLASGTIIGAFQNGTIVCNWRGQTVIIYTPGISVSNFSFYGSNANCAYAFVGNSSVAFATFSGFYGVTDLAFFAPSLKTSSYTLASISNLLRVKANMPTVTSISQLLGGDGRGTPASLYTTRLDLFAPKAETATRITDYGGRRFVDFVLRGGLPSATNINSMLNSYNANYALTAIKGLTFIDSEVAFPKVKTATAAFYLCSAFDQAIAFPSLEDGTNMFYGAGMSSASIAHVLDSLPTRTESSAGTGVITFTGCSGAAELTQESESVAAATAKGWTVEL